MSSVNSSTGADHSGALADQVGTVMTASKVLVAVIAASLSEVESTVTLAQLRVLVMASMRSPLTLGNVAEGLGVHASNATRTCDRLVGAALLDRRDDPADRRQLQLTLTTKGRRLVDSVMEHRRSAIERMVAKMDPAMARHLAAALAEFVDVADEFPDNPPYAVTWR